MEKGQAQAKTWSSAAGKECAQVGRVYCGDLEDLESEKTQQQMENARKAAFMARQKMISVSD